MCLRIVLALFLWNSFWGSSQRDTRPGSHLEEKPYPLSITLVGENAPPLRVGLPLKMNVKVENVSRLPMTLKVHSPDRAYRLMHFALNINGKEAPKTSFHRRMRGESLPSESTIGSGSIDFLTLKPNETLVFTVDITKLYDVSENGIYSFRVETYGDDGKETSAWSEPLVLDISR